MLNFKKRNKQFIVHMIGTDRAQLSGIKTETDHFTGTKKRVAPNLALFVILVHILNVIVPMKCIH